MREKVSKLFSLLTFSHLHNITFSPTFAVLSRKTMGYGDPGKSRQYPASPGFISNSVKIKSYETYIPASS